MTSPISALKRSLIGEWRMSKHESREMHQETVERVQEGRYHGLEWKWPVSGGIKGVEQIRLVEGL